MWNNQMDLQLPDLITLQLQEIAREQEREIPAILLDAIAEYVERHTNERAFRQQVRDVIGEHTWLLDELAEQ
jgi:predicted transcriptional regulator